MPTAILEREELCKKIHMLPDDMMPVISDFIDRLTDYDDEPLSEDELAQIEASKADIAAGRVYPWEEVKSRLDALP